MNRHGHGDDGGIISLDAAAALWKIRWMGKRAHSMACRARAPLKTCVGDAHPHALLCLPACLLVEVEWRAGYNTAIHPASCSPLTCKTPPIMCVFLACYLPIMWHETFSISSQPASSPTTSTKTAGRRKEEPSGYAVSLSCSFPTQEQILLSLLHATHPTSYYHPSLSPWRMVGILLLCMAYLRELPAL